MFINCNIDFLFFFNKICKYWLILNKTVSSTVILWLHNPPKTAKSFLYQNTPLSFLVLIYKDKTVTVTVTTYNHQSIFFLIFNFFDLPFSLLVLNNHLNWVLAWSCNPTWIICGWLMSRCGWFMINFLLRRFYISMFFDLPTNQVIQTIFNAYKVFDKISDWKLLYMFVIFTICC